MKQCELCGEEIEERYKVCALCNWKMWKARIHE